MTGTLVVVYDQRAGWVSDAEADERWATLCDDHNGLATHPTRRLAEFHAVMPEWCPDCQSIIEGSKDE